MSYILQALQRAEAERARGATPGLHTPTLPGAAPPPRPARTLPWAVAGATLTAGAALAWWLWPAAPAVDPVPATATPAPVRAPTGAPALPPAVAKAPAATAVPTPIIAAPPPEAVPRPEAPPPARRPAAETLPAAAATAAASRAPAAAPSQPAPAQPATAARALPTATAAGKGTPPPVPAPAAPAAPPASPVVPLAELPAPLRQALPPLNLGGGIYSPEPANRLLIVNGQVLRERAQLGPELVLESIGPKAAVFRFRQQRFEMRY